jgi:hypothetical protein
MPTKLAEQQDWLNDTIAYVEQTLSSPDTAWLAADSPRIMASTLVPEQPVISAGGVVSYLQ